MNQSQRWGCAVVGTIFMGWWLCWPSTHDDSSQTKGIQPQASVATVNVLGRSQDHDVRQVAWQQLSQTLNVQNPNLTKFVQAWQQGFSFEMKTAIQNAGLQNTITKLPSHLVYPCGGGDFYTLYAINPHASGYFILARDLVFPAHHEWGSLVQLLLHNQSFVDHAGRALTDLITNSNDGGFQFGVDLTSFSARYGMVVMLVAVLGSIPTITITTVSPITINGLKGVTLHCTRSVIDGSSTSRTTSEFDFHFLQLDLHDTSAVANVMRCLHNVWHVQRVVTVVKGAEGTFWPQNTSRAGLGSLNNSRIAEIMEEQEHYNKGVACLTENVLQISDVIIQDFTGLSFRSLARWSDGGDDQPSKPLENVHVFGAYLQEESMTEDKLAMAKYFENAHASASKILHSLGKLRYGYCQYVLSKEMEEIVRSRHVYTDHIDTYAATSTSTAHGLFCHLVIACKHVCL